MDEGCDFKDCVLSDLEGKELLLKDFFKNKKPLVLIGGSYSWPPFRKVESIHNIFEKYNKYVDFLVVYISEAHAVDEWPLGDHCVVKQHQNIEERIKMAKKFFKDFHFKLPMVVDTMKNEFDKLYYIWPERYYVIDNKKIVFSSKASQLGFNRKDLDFFYTEDMLKLDIK